jgi:hypothetical protein
MNSSIKTQSSSNTWAAGRHVLEGFVVAATLFFCLYAVFSESHWHLKTHLPGQADSRLNLNLMLWDTHVLREGLSWHELWQMPSLYPEANMLATSEHMLGETAIFAPIYLLTGQPVLAFNIVLILITILNFLCAYGVARRLLRAPTGALFCAVLFTFGSYRLYQILHFQLWVHFPTPLLFLAAVRTAERQDWRWPLFAGICLAGQFYLGMCLGYFAAVMVGIMLCALVLHRPAIFVDPRFLCRLGLAVSVAALLLLPLVGPYHEASARWGTWNWNGGMARFMPGWHNYFSPVLDAEPNPASLAYASERAIYWGYTAWILSACGVMAIIQQARRGERPVRFWAVACVLLVGALCCLSVNHFRSYQFLFLYFPGFNGLRVPGRLALLALWPCGLLGGYGMKMLGRMVLPWAPRRRALICTGVALLAFQENYHRLDVLQQFWGDVRYPKEEFYARVVGALPPGAIASIPMGLCGGGDPYPLTGAIAAGCRPSLNIYTGRVPHWWPTLETRVRSLKNPGQTAALIGEMRIRGIRFLIIDKDIGSAPLSLWCAARTSNGEPWGRAAYEDGSNYILDLDGAPNEATLAPEWSTISLNGENPPRGTENGGDGCLPVSGTISLEPTMPLRPGRYEAIFDVQAESEGDRCEIVRVYLDNEDQPKIDMRRNPVIIASAALHGQSLRLAFRVPEEKGPEPIFQFHIHHSGNGTMRVRQVRIEKQG